MLSISQRGKQMPPSPIRKLVPFAEAAKRKGIKVYHLNIGQPDIETPPEIIEAVRDAEIKTLEYSHSAGNESCAGCALRKCPIERHGCADSSDRQHSHRKGGAAQE